uniref:Uncharacterized protein n=1 Tax=Streptomyces avermitilis TaxID=33903 RepID=A0A499V216_STRAX|nr:hypothetical protein SAVMC3_01410 [Streptomyces avermitilis]
MPPKSGQDAPNRHRVGGDRQHGEDWLSGGRSPSPDWRKPSPLGLGVAVDAVTNVAAPLLAGFAIATIGVVGADGGHFRWPGPVLLCLTLSALLFVTCVQFGFHARRHLYSFADISAWWSDEEMRDHRDLLREEQNADFQLWNRWRGRAYTAYSGGMVMLWLGWPWFWCHRHGVHRLTRSSAGLQPLWRSAPPWLRPYGACIRR